MSAPYVPESAAELAGYLASVVAAAAKDHPDDEGLARGVAVHEAWKAAQEPATHGCDDCSVEPGETHRYPGCPGNQRTAADR